MFKFRKKVSEPSISVIVPLFNHARYIEDALKSVLDQTSEANEIILIDDGSTDSGFEIAERVLAKVPRARIFKQENAGAHNTINRAIGISNSEYVAVLNSDDLFIAGKLQRCRELLAECNGGDLVVGGIGIMDDGGVKQRQGGDVDWLKRSRSFLDRSGLQQLSLLNDNYVVTTSNMVFSRKLWEAAGGFQPLRYCHDLDFLMCACEFGSVVMDLDREHIVYRVHGRNTIKEDISKVRVEIAAVIANALYQSGARLLTPALGERDLDIFIEFLRNKQMSELLAFLQVTRSAFPTRTAYYEHILQPSLNAALRRIVSPD